MGGQLCRTGIWTLGLLIILRCGRADDASTSSAIAQTVQHAANNPQIANTNAKTVGGSATAASGAGLPAAATPLQTSDVNKALTTASQVATQILQNVPPAPKNPPKGVSVTPNSITLDAAAPSAQSVTLNPAGVTLASSPDSPSMTVGNAGVQYNQPLDNTIPGQRTGSQFPGSGESVVQSVPLNDAGTGIAQAGHTNFQPLGTNVGALSTPAQNTQATLASLGQGGHAPQQQRGQQRAQQQAAQLEGRQQSSPSSAGQQQQQSTTAGSSAGASVAQAQSDAAQEPAATVGTFPGKGPPVYTGVVTLTSAGAFPDMTDGGRRLLRQTRRAA